jgi:hypothetical protein
VCFCFSPSLHLSISVFLSFCFYLLVSLYFSLCLSKQLFNLGNVTYS